MKYRIVKNGLGEYGVETVEYQQLPPHGDWFPVTGQLITPWFTLKTEAENWIKRHTWEVVE